MKSRAATNASIANRNYCDLIDHFGLSDQTSLRHSNRSMYGISEIGHVLMQHYRGGTGMNLEIPTQGIIANDRGVRNAIVQELTWRADIKTGIANISAGMYEDFRYRDAFGDLNFEWELVTNTGGAIVVDIWFRSIYGHKPTAAKTLDAHGSKPLTGMPYSLMGKHALFMLVHNIGRSELQYANPDSSYFVRLRQTHSAGYYWALPITTLYPSVAGYFYAGGHETDLPSAQQQRRGASSYW